MAQRGTTPSSKAKGLTKSKTNAAAVQESQDFDRINKDLIQGLTESEVEIEHLKTTVIAINEKVEVLNDLKHDVVNHKNLLELSEVKRTQLQLHITETSIKIQQDTAEHASFQQSVIQENNELKDELLRQKDESDKLLGQTRDTHNQALQKLQNEKDNEIQHLQQTQRDADKQASQNLENLRNEHSNNTQQLRNRYDKTLQDTHEQHTQAVQKLIHDHNQTIQKLISDHNNDYNKLQQESSNLVQKIQREKDQEIQQLKEHQSQRDREHSQALENLRNESNEQLKKSEQLNQEQRARFESQTNEQDILIKKQKQIILELNSKIISLNEVITQKADVEEQLKSTKELLSEQDLQKQKLQHELETASDYIMELEEKVYKANKTSLELLRQLKDSEVEIETLKNYIMDLKQRIAVYIPMKDDVIDKRLAEFINNYPERQKLKIMFMRESEGVYQFGTKRVAVRVDKDKINIRVGGGYLSIDEFLDQYTPAELEKLERKDPLKKFAEKIAVQKTLIGKERNESSPIRSPTRSQSPTKSPTRKQQ